MSTISTIYRNTYLKQGILLHKRKYKDNQYLLVLWLQGIGKVHAVSTLSRKGYIEFQPFTILNFYIKLADIGSLSKVYQTEVVDSLGISGTIEKLYGLYINEVLYSVMEQGVFYSDLFDHYISMLKALNRDQARLLVCKFCMSLLDNIGYGLQFAFDSQGDTIKEDKFYKFNPLAAFSPSINANSTDVFQGKLLRKMHDPESWSFKEMLQVEYIVHRSLSTYAPSCKFLTKDYLSFIEAQ